VCNVITSVGPGKTAPGPGAPTGHFVPNYTQENAVWSFTLTRPRSDGRR
jgi:hypothetical protein